MSSAGTAQKPFGPGLPEGGAPGPRLSGKIVTVPMVVATGAVMIFAVWAFDSLRWRIAIPVTLAALAIALFVSIRFGQRAMHKSLHGERQGRNRTDAEHQS